MNLKQELIRENSSEEKHILPQKQLEKWELKSKTQQEELLPHRFLLKKWRQAELWKGERLAGGRGELTEPSLGFVLPAGHISTALTSLSHSYLILLPPGALGQKPAWQHGWKNEEGSDRAAFCCTQNNAVFIPSHHSVLLAQGSGPCRHPEPQGEDGVTCEQNPGKWWLVSNASKSLIRKRNGSNTGSPAGGKGSTAPPPRQLSMLLSQQA